jgi:hypothetical protein
MSLDLSLIGKVSAQDVQLAEGEVWSCLKALDRAKSAHPNVGRKLIFWKGVGYLHKLAALTDGKSAAILVVGGVCLAFSAPVMLLCSSSVGTVFLGMAAALLIGIGISAALLYKTDQIRVQEKLNRLSEERLIRERRIEESRHLLRIAEDHYSELSQVFEYPINRLLTTDWRLLRGSTFEDFVKDAFQALGYLVEANGRPGGQGVDLILEDGPERIAVQCKGYSEAVSNHAVQEVYAGHVFHDCQRCVVVTKSTFTPNAQKLAASLRCILIDGEHIEDLIRGRILSRNH